MKNGLLKKLGIGALGTFLALAPLKEANAQDGGVFTGASSIGYTDVTADSTGVDSTRVGANPIVFDENVYIANVNPQTSFGKRLSTLVDAHGMQGTQTANCDYFQILNLYYNESKGKVAIVGSNAAMFQNYLTPDNLRLDDFRDLADSLLVNSPSGQPRSGLEKAAFKQAMRLHDNVYSRDARKARRDVNILESLSHDPRSQEKFLVDRYMGSFNVDGYERVWSGTVQDLARHAELTGNDSEEFIASLTNMFNEDGKWLMDKFPGYIAFQPTNRGASLADREYDLVAYAASHNTVFKDLMGLLDNDASAVLYELVEGQIPSNNRLSRRADRAAITTNGDDGGNKYFNSSSNSQRGRDGDYQYGGRIRGGNNDGNRINESYLQRIQFGGFASVDGNGLTAVGPVISFPVVATGQFEIDAAVYVPLLNDFKASTSTNGSTTTTNTSDLRDIGLGRFTQVQEQITDNVNSSQDANYLFTLAPGITYGPLTVRPRLNFTDFSSTYNGTRLIEREQQTLNRDGQIISTGDLGDLAFESQDISQPAVNKWHVSPGAELGFNIGKLIRNAHVTFGADITPFTKENGEVVYELNSNSKPANNNVRYNASLRLSF